jgi:hypothetical protein
MIARTDIPTSAAALVRCAGSGLAQALMSHAPRDLEPGTGGRRPRRPITRAAASPRRWHRAPTPFWRTPGSPTGRRGNVFLRLTPIGDDVEDAPSRVRIEGSFPGAILRGHSFPHSAPRPPRSRGVRRASAALSRGTNCRITSSRTASGGRTEVSRMLPSQAVGRASLRRYSLADFE